MAMIEMKMRPWLAPNFAQVESPVGRRQDGILVPNGIPVAEIPEHVLHDMALDWVSDLYRKAGKPCPWVKLKPSGGKAER